MMPTDYTSAPPSIVGEAIATGRVRVPGVQQASDSTAIPVWTGTQMVRPPIQLRRSGHVVAGTEDPRLEEVEVDAVSTVGEQQALFYTMEQSDIERLRSLASRLGADVDIMSLRSLWYEAIDLASEAYNLSGGQTKMTPWEAAELLASDMEAAREEAMKDQTTSSSQVTLTDPDSAEAVLLQTFESMLGRRPSSDETSAFVAALNAYEQARPSTSATTLAQGDDGTMSTTTTQQGAASPSVFGQQYVLDEFGQEEQEYRVATKYANVIDSLFGNAPDVTGEIENF